MRKIGLILFDNSLDLGTKVYNEIKKNNDVQIELIKPMSPRFGNGEAKVSIDTNINGMDVYILSDVGNHNCTYKIYGYENRMSPDDHFMDIKRCICAMMNMHNSLNVIMPLLYASRQHKRNGNESLDCALALQELKNLKVDTITSIDVHDPSIQNAIPYSSFENIYPTEILINAFIKDNKFKSESLLVISPDTGAMDRARYFADELKCDVGLFYKRRDLSKVVNGKNPIIAHEYIGVDINNSIAIIVDDMIASGESILEVAKEVKKRNSKKIYLFSTFALFTNDIKIFDEAYENKIFDKLYTTNATYINDEYRKRQWLVIVDCSKIIAKSILENSIKKSNFVE